MDLKKNELEIYDYPAQNILKKKSILGIFLGYYERWDSLRNYEVSKDNGFLAYEPELEGCYFNFEKIDNHQHGIHDYFKFLKFGFARATDQLCYMIRRNKITRENAINLVKKLEGKYPKSYMGKSLDQILSQLPIILQDVPHSLKIIEIELVAAENASAVAITASKPLTSDIANRIIKNLYMIHLLLQLIILIKLDGKKIPHVLLRCNLLKKLTKNILILQQEAFLID